MDGRISQQIWEYSGIKLDLVHSIRITKLLI